MLGTSNYVNYSRRNPKRSAKYVYLTETLVSFIARAETSFIKKERRESSIHLLNDGPSVSSGVRHQERKTSRTSIWLKAGKQGIPYG